LGYTNKSFNWLAGISYSFWKKAEFWFI
jgi:hypothetical protein